MKLLFGAIIIEFLYNLIEMNFCARFLVIFIPQLVRFFDIIIIIKICPFMIVNDIFMCMAKLENY
jgi:hypothetical protein